MQRWPAIAAGAVLVAVVLVAGCRGSEADAAPGKAAAAIEVGASGELDVTSGKLEAGEGGMRRVAVAKMRAVAPGSSGDAATLRFRYLGATDDVARLGSGSVRRQLGLKLRADSGCNLVYVMWRLAPKPGVVVSLKRNPGQSRHSQCGNRGYRNLRPVEQAAAPVIEPGATHTLAAAITGDDLRVTIDGQQVWRGPLGADARGLRGPAGVRTDNVKLDFALTTDAD